MDGFDHKGVRKKFNIPDNFPIPLLREVGYFDKIKEFELPTW
jgi:hypothetical protein